MLDVLGGREWKMEKMGQTITAGANSYPHNKHRTFKERYGTDSIGHERRLEYGLDYIKAMPDEWTDEQRWAMMVELYDDLISIHNKGVCSGCGEVSTALCGWCQDDPT